MEKWIELIIEIQSLAQNGLAYTNNVYDKERFERLRDISAEMLSMKSDLSLEKVKDLFCSEKGYQTPKLDTRAVIFKDDKILLVGETIMQELMLSLMSKYGYFAVCFLIAIENIFPPIPSEVILIGGGFLTTTIDLNVVIMIIAATLGSVIGAIALYYIGKIFNKERLKRIVSGKIGKVLRLKE